MEIYVSSSNNATFEPTVDANISVFTGRHGHVCENAVSMSCIRSAVAHVH